MKIKTMNYFKYFFTRPTPKPSYNTDKLINTINEKWITKNCSLCGNNDYTISSILVELHEHNNENKIIPLVPITCNNCGNTIFISPLTINCIDAK